MQHEIVDLFVIPKNSRVLSNCPFCFCILDKLQYFVPKSNQNHIKKFDKTEEYFGFEPKQSEINWQIQPSILEYKGR